MGLYGIGQAVPREEDPRLLKGRGRYCADLPMARETRAVVLRSPHAHAAIAALDTRASQQMPGVLAVLTGEDLRRRGLGSLRPAVPRKRSSGAPAYIAPQPLLAQDRVRFVGEPVALVVAETLDLARDAAERIEVSYEALPAV
ncbi:MAG: xanthine dehydrogenase family protein molybdopterin-binding subunit, partial [Stellaceae bacterium]